MTTSREGFHVLTDERHPRYVQAQTGQSTTTQWNVRTNEEKQKFCDCVCNEQTSLDRQGTRLLVMAFTTVPSTARSDATSTYFLMRRVLIHGKWHARAVSYTPSRTSVDEWRRKAWRRASGLYLRSHCARHLEDAGDALKDPSCASSSSKT